MQAMSSNWEDIRKYYEGAYIKLKEFGEQVVLVNRVRSDALYFTNENQDEGVVYLHDEAPYEITMNMPHKAIFQYGDHAVAMFRLPQRQYHKGITSSNCGMTRLTSKGWAKVQLSFNYLNAYTQKPNYRTLDQAILDPGDRVSEAVDRRWAVTQGKLYLDDKAVGFCHQTGKRIVVPELLVPEVLRLLSDDTTFKVTSK